MSTFLVLFILSPHFVLALDILAVFPHAGKSHIDVFRPLFDALHQRGHNVTVVSNFPRSRQIPNYHHVTIGDINRKFLSYAPLEGFPLSLLGRWIQPKILKELAETACQDLFTSSDLKQLLKSNRTFDLLIAEFFHSDCALALLEKYNVPLIGVCSSTIFPWFNQRMGNPDNPSYIPQNMLLLGDKMSFFERVENFVFTGLHNMYYWGVMHRNDQKIVDTLYGDVRLSKYVNNASVFLVNSHFTLTLARPLVPSVIEISGIHIKPAKKLSVNLEKWINESSHGVIYFSLGSMIKGHTFPEEKRREFLKAFSRLPQRVLWKYENETMPGKPDNVMIQKWMPQLDILCHPNVKAFISHGGLLGTTEAVHCGVPVMVMPQFGDQFTNAKALEATGGGVILHLDDVTEDTVYNSLNTILDPKFKKQAEELSERFRDRPLPPLETAIYWVEYVARHKGAHHMRTAAVGMPLYKYLLLDVIAFLLLTTTIVIYITFLVLRAICRKLFFQKPKSLTKQKKH